MKRYKPYSREWHRKRFLKEALDMYLDESVDIQTIIGDIMGILNDRSESSFADFRKTTILLSELNGISRVD